MGSWVSILSSFRRVKINKGETKTISFELTPEELAIWNREMKRVVEPGAFEVMVGGNSVELIKISFEVVDR